MPASDPRTIVADLDELDRIIMENGYHAEPQHLTVGEACAVADAGLASLAAGQICGHCKQPLNGKMYRPTWPPVCEECVVKEAAATATGE